ncbi:MAG: ParB/RepB/Spo0J family partition protein [Alphaproteobacteria bacterium]|nr:ParB/RepB/Spo0J family partition protein [Alphaproteobacteria bacterium]
MAKIEKISLSQSRDIPFDKLVLSSRNVRRIQTGLSIEELAEDIAKRTLLQSLSVRPMPDKDGFYEVQAGGRRYRALEMLVKQKRLAKNAPIPCIVREDGILEEDSLAENIQRINLHPLDQFRAFQSLRDQGIGDEEIAARFFVTPQIVKQRLKLASVSLKLLEIYAADEMSLEQLMAFSVSDDHARQEQVWETVNRGYNHEPYLIKRLLTENSIPSDDKRALFVGIEAYEAAGGAVSRDLFSADDAGWLQDVALLERLVAEKLKREAEAIKNEGWKWLQVAEDFPYGHIGGLRRINGEIEPLSEEDQNRYAALQEEMGSIEEEYVQDGEEVPEEIEKRLVEIENALNVFENRPVHYDPAEVAIAGAFVSIDDDGSLKVERGFVRREDEAGKGDDAEGNSDTPDRSSNIMIVSVSDRTPSNDGSPSAGDEAEEDATKPLSDRLVMELTAHRTLGLRNALANDPDTAFLAVLHVLVLNAFYHYETESCLEITAKNPRFSVQSPDLKSCASAKVIDERHAAWEKQLPQDAKELWNTLCAFDADSRSALFAHCASMTINAVHEPWNRALGRKRHADQLAEMLSLDMVAAGWKPTASNYLSRVSKVRILEAVTEAKGAAAAEWIENLRKADMANQAERLLEDTGWLPEPLRSPGVERVAVQATTSPDASAQQGASAELPAFLSEAA